MPIRNTVTQQTQIEIETTVGTLVPATKILEGLDITLGAKVQTKEYRPQGRKHASQVLIEKEWTEGKYSGIADFTSLAFPLSVFGAPTTTTVFTTATQRVFSPVLTGVATPQSFSIQKGDATYAEGCAYGLFNTFNLKSDRKEVTVSGDIIAQSLSEGVTLTAAPTVVAAVPIVANMVQIYLDPTSAGIGTTLLTDTYEYNLAYGPAYSTAWPINSANSSFSKHIDLAPKGEIKLTLQADSVAAGLKTAMENGTTQYIRWTALGPTVGTAGNYKLTIDAAVRISDIAAFADKDGIYSVTYTGMLVEDPAWTANGQCLVATLVNNFATI